MPAASRASALLKGVFFSAYGPISSPGSSRMEIFNKCAVTDQYSSAISALGCLYAGAELRESPEYLGKEPVEMAGSLLSGAIWHRLHRNNRDYGIDRLPSSPGACPLPQPVCSSRKEHNSARSAKPNRSPVRGLSREARQIDFSSFSVSCHKRSK